MKIRTIAVVGAAGNIGQEILKTLAERAFPLEKITALAASSAPGHEVSFGENEVLSIGDVARFDFKGTDLCFFAADEKTTQTFAPRAAAAGCIVIDTSPCFRMDPDVPLIVPEVNSAALAGYKKKNIIASPGTATTPLLVVLKPLHDKAKIKRLVLSVFFATGEKGHKAMDELFTQTRAIYVNDPMEKEIFRKQIAFNLIPHVGDFMDDGSTKEEWGLAVEIKKTLDPHIKVAATCLFAPVFVGHALAVSIEFENELSASEARALLKESESLSVVDRRHEDGFVTQAECAGEDSIFVGRIREDISVENGLSLWIVSDNLRKGSALNAVQIAEALKELP